MTIYSELDQPIYLGKSADLRELYVPGESGIECLCCKDTYMNSHALWHISHIHPERLDWLEESTELIRQAVTNPEIVYRHLDYKPVIDHWSQACIVQNPYKNAGYITVVLSLARVSGEKSEIHQVITVHQSKERDFYKNTGEVKDRWMEVIK